MVTLVTGSIKCMEKSTESRAADSSLLGLYKDFVCIQSEIFCGLNSKDLLKSKIII